MHHYWFKRSILALSLSIIVPMGLSNLSWAEDTAGEAQLTPAEDTTVIELIEKETKTTPVNETLETIELEPVLEDEQNPPAQKKPAGRQPLEAKAVVVDIASDTLNYDKEANLYTAIGDVHVVISEQNSELIADKVFYDPAKELVIADGHVIITKDGQKTYGTYAKIDLTRKSALVNDPYTKLEKVRVQAKQAFVDQGYAELENGKIIIDQEALSLSSAGSSGKHVEKGGRVEDMYAEDLSTLAFVHRYESDNAPRYDADPLHHPPDGYYAGSKFRIHAEEIEVTRHSNQIDDVIMKDPKMYWGKRKLGRFFTSDFMHDELTGDTHYLGPDIGYDPDYGGAFGGPGWDFRLGRGVVRVSPIVSYGGGGRRIRGGQDFESKTGPGVGGILHYRSHKMRLDAAYNSNVGQPVGFMEYKLGSGKTRIQAAMNEDYTNGFLGFERPRYIAQLTDSRKVAQFGNFRVDTFSSAGYAKDEFFPNNSDTQFVTPDDPDSNPIRAGRLQIQAQLRNIKPLLSWNDDMVTMGFRAQIAGSAYTTGDFYGLARVGPNVNFRLFKNRLRSSIQYFVAQTIGDTPFVFDQYFRGRQNLVLTNAFRVNDYFTVGTRNNLNLLRDGSNDNMMVGNQFFILAGPKDVKFNIAYDFIRKRSYFGIQFYPGQGNPIEYDKLKMFQPVNYTNKHISP